MPKLKNHSGSKKRFKFTASGLVKAQAQGKRHGMSKRPQKMKRNARGTFVMFKADGEKIAENFLRVK
ncbi:50S ribosomal protein L35 [Aerophototrophica crusticola]|uniref:Large ribosomal subunit protein bL35 n=1 Tax=Aerophototrophica crusticola TaxID=1709002 RepID=A0A858R9A8_9PROT|nr:50S ribosomal protein L35 [Rhodospirillaceae bacterium B3]